MVISKRGKEYRSEVIEALKEQHLDNEGISGRISVLIAMNPPSNHKRDLDNYFKVPLDAITKAGFWIDDSQIDSLKMVRGSKSKLGNLEIEVRELSNV